MLVALHLVLQERTPVVKVEVAYLAVLMLRGLELMFLHGVDATERGIARRVRARDFKGGSHG